jgi:hypothetical protein
LQGLEQVVATFTVAIVVQVVAVPEVTLLPQQTLIKATLTAL